MSFRQKISMFMILLIITIPIYASTSYATFSNIRVSGQQNVPGFYRGPDYQQDLQPDVVRVDLVATDNGAPITDRGRVRFSTSPSGAYDASQSTQFTSCDESGSCYFTTSQDLGDLAAIYLYQYSTAGTWEGSYPTSLVKDKIAPDIVEYSMTPNTVTTSNVTITFKVHDYAYSTGVSGICSGIKQIKFERNSFSKVYDNVTPVNQCYYENSFKVNPLELGTGADQESVPILMTVYDRVGHVTQVTTAFTIDKKAPAVDSNTYTLTKNNVDIEFLNSAVDGAAVGFTLSAPEQDLQTVIVDVSQLNKNAPAAYKTKSPNCVNNGNGIYDCTIAGITVDINQSMVASIFINASDSLGNRMPGTSLGKQLYYDIIGPEVRSIKTDRVFNDVNYLGYSGKVVVEFEESGSGIAEAYMDLSAVGKSSSQKTTNCTSSGSTYICTWYNITAPSAGSKSVSVLSTTKDKIGNAVTGTLTGSLTVDLSRPTYSSHTVTNLGLNQIPGIYKLDDAVQVEMTVIDNVGIASAVGNFSSIVEDADELIGVKTSSSGSTYTFRWQTDPINIPGYISSDLTFTITDYGGNRMLYTVPMDVLGINASSSEYLNYWKSRVSCTPNVLDRSIATLINQKTYCKVTLSPNNAGLDVETLALALGTCVDDKNSSTISMIANAQGMNMQAGSTEPYILLTIAQTEADINTINIKCPIQIISRVGTEVTSNIEEEYAEIELGFYNAPIGQVDEGLKSQIDDVQEFNEGIWKVVGLLKTIIGYLEMACNLLNTINNAVTFFQTVFNPNVQLARLAPLGPAEAATAAASSASCTAGETLEIGNEGFFQFHKGFCSFVTCEGGGDFSNKGKQPKADGIMAQINSGINSWPETSGYNSMMRKVAGEPGSAAKGGTIRGWMSDGSYMNAKDNLIVAIWSGCIPGIIRGIDKYRQIQCMYGDCLIKSMQTNVPVSVCEEQKSYATCKYIVGEIFALIPWTAALFQFLGQIRSLLTDPGAALGFILSTQCQAVVVPCDGSKPAAIEWLKWKPFCSGVMLVSKLGELIADVQGLIKNGFDLPDDYCEAFEDAYDEAFDEEE
ncbi:MAG: hypothetical protein KJ601_03725 [Nanoarchaeota archaeon]|nr:hypothetical protein [Nanoarchaeota archaeon]MBU1703907.1 hypothetical protein [Nanoarchaeota archaeon]